VKSTHAAVEALQGAVRATKSSQASTYVPQCAAQADSLLAAVLEIWRSENRRWLPRRDLARVEQGALDAAGWVRACGKRSSTIRDSLQGALDGRLAANQQMLGAARAAYARLPQPKSAQRHLVDAELLQRQAAEAYRSGELTRARDLLKRSETLGREWKSRMESALDTYLRDLPTWRSWADSAIARSKRTKTTAVVVDKLAAICRVYVSGSLAHEYSAEFGPNWMQQKNFQGDDATPEGQYRVVRKKQGSATIYYKALAIDYPNRQDTQRIAELRKNGALPRSATAGGHIEIHGKGGRGAHWTEGCVALDNDDMDEVYRLVAEGAPVVIVGALSRPAVGRDDR
jgi:hypothetical protein